MSYQCPKCGGKVSRGYSSSAQMAAGLVGALFYMAFGSFECKKCGKISKSEFSSSDQARMTMGSLIMIIIAVIIGIAVIMLINSK